MKGKVSGKRGVAGSGVHLQGGMKGKVSGTRGVAGSGVHLREGGRFQKKWN